MSDSESSVLLGHISGVHGLNGWVKVHAFTDPRTAIFTYQPWWLGEARKEIHLDRGQPQGKTLIAKLIGIDSVEQARQLVGEKIRVPRSSLPDSEPGQWYWSDLQGLTVENRAGVVLGQVQRMIETGAHDVMILTGDRERLVPFVPGVFVDKVDLAAGRIIVDWHEDD